MKNSTDQLIETVYAGVRGHSVVTTLTVHDSKVFNSYKFNTLDDATAFYLDRSNAVALLKDGKITMKRTG